MEADAAGALRAARLRAVFTQLFRFCRAGREAVLA
jgi:hypothetical protein